ncbi:MAG: response regulator [Verrucomicrobiota bacterium]|jgi:HD-like signal output (HDOD) protein
MKKILFVEDNELLLELYGTMLDRERDQWHTTLVPNGQAALALLHQTVFDVVVSDLQMPGVGGIELLTEVRRLHPQTSRIIISGFADQAEVADSLKCTHLFIPKPFNAKTLRAALARIGGLDAYLQDDKLRKVAGKMRNLPSFPTLYLDILSETESPHSSIQGIASIVSREPAITAKILQVANSAGVGLAERVRDPAEAVQRLGMTTVRSLVLSAQVYSRYAPGRVKGFSADALWDHLVRCGDLARTIMCDDGAPAADAGEAFTAGILHDIGKLMLADSLPEEFAAALELAAREKIPQTEAEQVVLGADHAGLAAYLLGLWGLPASIVETVAFHHWPQRSDLKQYSALTAVHVANAFLNDAGGGSLNREYLAQIGVADRLNDWRQMVMRWQMGQAAG